MISGLDIPKSKLWELVFRLVVVAGLLFLSSNYVSNKDYKADEAKRLLAEEAKTKTLQDILITLARIDERSRSDDTRQRVQKLEERVQQIEKKIP